LRREQIVALLALLGVAALAWGYTIWLAGRMAMPPAASMSMPDMPGMRMDESMMAPGHTPWTVIHFLFIFAMWAVMMVGMMTPTVAPMVLIYARVARHANGGGELRPAAWFFSGYLAAWTLFAALAALAQWGLEALALLTPMMSSASRRFGGMVLVAAGLYQWLPIKDVCLTGCRSPLSFLQRHGGFQASPLGSLRLGFLHGGYCVGCCWALMALLFAVGVMNLLWIAALMCFVLLEKVLPGGRWLSRVAGCAAIGAGVWMVTVP
jgi:predicted metal-binding membrane protein